MNYQVNLLEEVEVRDTSRVSKKFMMILGVGALVAVLFLTVLITSWRLNSVEGKLAEVQAEIEELKPEFERALKVKEDLAWREKVFSELEGWQSASVDLDEFLNSMGMLVPENIQMIDLRFEGNLSVRAPLPDAPVQRVRKYNMQLSGKAVGEGADSAVLEFIRSLQDSKDFEGLLTSAKLQRMHNAGATLKDDGQVVRSFSIDCAMEERAW